MLEKRGGSEQQSTIKPFEIQKGIIIMKNMFKKILSLVLCVVMIFMIGSVNPAYAADDSREIIDSGDCGLYGDNLKWILYSDGELEISGNGEMNWYFTDYAMRGKDRSYFAPWQKYFKQINFINIKEGVTSIGLDALIDYDIEYSKVNLPKSLKYFESYGYRDQSTLFEDIGGNQAFGKHIAFCYAGSQNDWDKVECRYYTVEFNESAEKYERTYVRTSLSNRIEHKHQKLYLNGEEPVDFCEIETSSGRTEFNINNKLSLNAHYYAADTGATLVWSIDGESVFIDGETEKTETGRRAHILFLGDANIKLKLVSQDGEVLAEDEITIKTLPERTFFQKIGDRIVEAFLTFGIIFVGVVGGTFGPMIGSIANWFHSIFN